MENPSSPSQSSPTPSVDNFGALEVSRSPSPIPDYFDGGVVQRPPGTFERASLSPDPQPDYFQNDEMDTSTSRESVSPDPTPDYFETGAVVIPEVRLVNPPISSSDQQEDPQVLPALPESFSNSLESTEVYMVDEGRKGM